MKSLERALAGSVANRKAALWTTAAWALLALIAIVPIGLLSLYSYEVARNALTSLVETKNHAVAIVTAEMISRQLERRLDLARTFAAMPTFVNAVTAHDVEEVRARLAVAVTNMGIDRAIVFDLEAKLWADYPVDTNILGRHFRERDWYRGVTNTWKPYLSEVYLRQAKPSVLVVAIATPILKDNKPVGFLVHHYPLDSLADWLKRINLGHNGCVLVVDHTGTVAAHSSPGLDLRAQTYEHYGSIAAVQDALAGRMKDGIYVDPLLQREMVATFMPLRVLKQHWVVVTEEPVEDAYAPLRELSLQLAAGTAVLAVVAGLVVLVLGRNTERTRRLHRQLEEERNLLRSLIDTLPDLVYVKDMESRFIVANKAVARLMGGNAPEDVLGKADTHFFPADLAARYRADELAVCRSGLPLINQEEPVLERDGTQHWLTTTKVPLRDSQGRVVGVVGIGRDISRRKLAEEALRASEERLQAMLDNTIAVVYLKDPEGRYLLINQQYEALFHVKREQIVGKTDYDVFPKEAADAFARNDRRVLEEDRPLQLEEVAPHDDGPHTYLSVKFPLHDQTGRASAICGISTDITDRKRAEAEVQRAREVAEQASQAKSEFLANMSHELRTPLNSVIGFANILLKNKRGNLARDELVFLERIQVNGRHLLALINQILDLSKIEARRLDLEAAPVVLERLVRDVLAQFESQVRGRPLHLKADLPRPIAPLVTDEGKLRQVLFNLIGNAVKFTEKGSVTVRVAVDEGSRRPLRVDVIDTGIGIRADRQAVIFEAFRQADATTTRKYGGTGLGLTISKALCDLMGYHIEVQSEPGRGSTFSVLLTQTLEAGQAAGPPCLGPLVETPPVFPSGKTKLVLVIDDELDSRTLLSHLIQECGCRAVVAESGEAGLKLARELRPDVIILDLLMPRMDGWTVLKELRADATLRKIPVVIASVVGAESRGTLLCAWAVLQKPVTREDLQRVLQPFPHPKVLVVEDNEDHRRLMAAHLAGQAVEIAMAANGQEALQMLETFRPDLIVLDLMMPDMDGMSFLGAIRKDSRYWHLPVFVVTAKELTPEESRCLSVEAQAVLRKSNDWGEDLEPLLQRVLRAQWVPASEPAPAPAGPGDGSDQKGQPS
jgi:PAS domain S-box-containing protein